MAVEVKVPKEIKDYKEKIIAGLSLRQLACLSVAIGLNVVLSLVFIKGLSLSMDIVSWIMILVSMPIVSFGWFKKNGLSFEEYMKAFFHYHLSSGQRTYQKNEMIQEEAIVAESKKT